MLARFPDHPQATEVRWRQGNLAFAHGWFERAAEDFSGLAAAAPRDPRAPQAASLRADALFRLGRFEAAGAAFEIAARVAHDAGRDSLERSATLAIPVCYYRHAESVAASDSANHAKQAELFEQVATRWPRYEHAHLAQYRAGLAYLKARKTAQGVKAMETLIQTFPGSEYVKDAHLQVAKAWEAEGARERAADAYLAFAQRYAGDESAPAAWLKAGDLLADGGQVARADTLRLAYIRRYPADLATAMEILEAMARRELAQVGPDHPISALLPHLEAAKPARRSTAQVAARQKRPVTAPSRLAEYLQRAEVHPDLASRDLLAQVRFLQGEEAMASFQDARLSQPLEKSIPVKQKLLDEVIARYRGAADLGASQWADGSAYRIGEALAAFGDVLERSEHPADLQGDDLRGYEDVLAEQAQPFYDRAEGVWSDLLRQRGDEVRPDSWVAHAQASLWQRLAGRFYYRPETEYPLVSGTAPDRVRERDRVGAASSDTAAKEANVRAQREDDR